MTSTGRSGKLRQFLRRIRISTNAVLQYDSGIDDLIIWKWYVTAIVY